MPEECEIDLVLFHLAKRWVGGGWGMGMMTLCAEGLVTQRSVFFLLRNIWSGIITAFPVILGIPFSFRNAKGANAILLL